MNDSSAQFHVELKLSQPTVANGQIHFSAFGPGWGFCAYTVPANVVMKHLGARDPSAAQLRLAFQLNRQRIVAAVVEGGVCDPCKRVLLLNI